MYCVEKMCALILKFVLQLKRIYAYDHNIFTEISYIIELCFAFSSFQKWLNQNELKCYFAKKKEKKNKSDKKT